MNFKIKMCASFLILLLTAAILSVALITGGVSHAQQERYIFEVTAENNTSKVATVMQVYAVNEKDARENVAANGWKVLSVKQLTYRQASPAPVASPNVPDIAPYVPSFTDADQEHASAQVPAMTDDELIDSLLGPQAAENDTLTQDAFSAHVAVPEVPQTVPDTRYNNDEQLKGVPDVENLLHRATVYFDLGVVQPSLRPSDTAILAGVDKMKFYYLFGHTDNVSVIPNPEYKDNFELSVKRAEAVKAILEANGTDPAKMNTMGFGALYPDVKNLSSPHGTPQNRRVEIYEVRQAE